MNDYDGSPIYRYSSLRVEKSTLPGKAGLVLCLLLLFSMSPGICDEYLDIGRKAYLNRVVSLSRSMAGQMNRYEALAGKINSEVKRRNCIADRLIIAKAIINAAENYIPLLAGYTNRSGKMDTGSGEFHKTGKTFEKLLEGFYGKFTKFHRLFIQIDSCMLKFDRVVEEDGDQIVILYKR